MAWPVSGHVLTQSGFREWSKIFDRPEAKTDLRAAAERFTLLKEGTLDAVRNVHVELMGRFKQLSLKGDRLQEGIHVTEFEVDTFFNLGRELFFGPASTFKRGDIKRIHLTTGRLGEFLQTHAQMDPCKLELTKECWRSQFLALRNANNGEMPKDAVGSLLHSYECPFGCPAPMTDPHVFVDMHNAPRPRQSGTSVKYVSFSECYGPKIHP